MKPAGACLVCAGIGYFVRVDTRRGRAARVRRSPCFSCAGTGGPDTNAITGERSSVEPVIEPAGLDLVESEVSPGGGFSGRPGKADDV
jgi:hypothetical protein